MCENHELFSPTIIIIKPFVLFRSMNVCRLKPLAKIPHISSTHSYSSTSTLFSKKKNVLSYQHIDGLNDVDEDLVLLVFDSL